MTVTLEQVADYGNLYMAYLCAKRGKSHYQSIKEFEKDVSGNLHKIQSSLLSGMYHTSKYRHMIINDNGKNRLISKLPFYPDRIVHWAIMLQMGHLFIQDFSIYSHAAIKNKGIHTALYQVRDALLHDAEGTQYCLKLDVKKYFPHISHTLLKRMIQNMDIDNRLYAVHVDIIDSVPEEMGVPIGNYLSQFYANKYLSRFDYFVKSVLKIPHYIRYMDDIIIFGVSPDELRKVYRDIEWYLKSHLFLDIKDNWQIFSVKSRGVDFIGYKAYHNRVLLRKSTLKGLIRTSNQVIRDVKNMGYISDRNRSRIMSYCGWLVYCTPAIRKQLFRKYIEPILIQSKIQLSTKLLICYYN